MIKKILSIAHDFNELLNPKYLNHKNKPITHLIPKNMAKAHKKWLESEGFDHDQCKLPKDHPWHKTHYGITSPHIMADSYHEDFATEIPHNRDL